MHTNDAPSAVTRLIDMGVEPFLISSSVLAMMAQRLVRVICPNCREPFVPDVCTKMLADTEPIRIVRSGLLPMVVTSNRCKETHCCPSTVAGAAPARE